jgi:hypothetical protein
MLPHPTFCVSWEVESSGRLGEPGFAARADRQRRTGEWLGSATADLSFRSITNGAIEASATVVILFGKAGRGPNRTFASYRPSLF